MTMLEFSILCSLASGVIIFGIVVFQKINDLEEKISTLRKEHEDFRFLYFTNREIDKKKNLPLF